MFEKEAKEYGDNYVKSKYMETVDETWRKGAEFGYNKAKEDADKMKSRFLELCNLKDMRIAELEKANGWHYVKNELPIGKPYQNGTKAFVTVAYINNYNVPRKLDCYYWNNKFLCDSTYGYKKVEDIYGKVYAWKYEDKLPELKERVE